MIQEAVAAVTDTADDLAAFKSQQLHLLTDQGGILEQTIFRTSGQNAQAVMTDGLFMLIVWFSVFFFILLMGLMIYWVIRYRRRPGVPVFVSASHNEPLEIFWTVVPSSALLVIFLAGFQGYMAKVVAPADAIQLNVSGFKWDWNITYPNGEQSQYTLPLGTKPAVKIFVLPEDTSIQLLMQSRDVIHSFWVPDYRTKMDLYPNRYTTYTFRTEKLRRDELYRDHWIFCAEYCGDSHSEMYGIFRVVSRENYDRILSDWNTGNLSCEDLGKLVYKNNCISCHSVDGSRLIGPTWLGSFGTKRALEGGGEVVVDENYIRESILYPQAKRSAGFEGQVMTSFLGQLSDQEIEGVICYFKALAAQPAGEDGSTGNGATGEPAQGEDSGGGSTGG
ncbi:MAG: cytochrome c oxidase subunit II [Phycisphaerales bacterium]